MNVSVGREFEEYVRAKVKSGDYVSVSEVVRDGLRLLQEKERLLEARLQSLRVKSKRVSTRWWQANFSTAPQSWRSYRRN